MAIGLETRGDHESCPAFSRGATPRSENSVGVTSRLMAKPKAKRAGARVIQAKSPARPSKARTSRAKPKASGPKPPTSPIPAEAFDEPRDPVIENTIFGALASKQDVTEAFRVYGDWLLQQG